MSAADHSVRARWNAARFDPADAGGHYESWFQRANHPQRPLAFWIRYTIFSPRGRPQDAVGELWAIWFDGEQASVRAAKQVLPLADCAFSGSGLEARIGAATLRDGALAGSADGPQHHLDWDLHYDGGGDPLLLLPQDRYNARLPRAKALVGRPSVLFHGRMSVDGQAHDIAGWRGSQNHNWGSRHTDEYAWGQVCGFDDAPDAFLEVATARVKLGPLWTPRMTLAVLRLDGREYRFDRPWTAVRAQGECQNLYWAFDTRQDGARLAGRIKGSLNAFVGLNYDNPPGGRKICLNSKLARCELHLTADGQTRSLTSNHGAAFEILSDAGDARIPVVA
jgi:hypothetical protein